MRVWRFFRLEALKADTAKLAQSYRSQTGTKPEEKASGCATFCTRALSIHRIDSALLTYHGATVLGLGPWVQAPQGSSASAPKLAELYLIRPNWSIDGEWSIV
jgi:hypothetical protein